MAFADFRLTSLPNRHHYRHQAVTRKPFTWSPRRPKSLSSPTIKSCRYYEEA